MKGFLFTLLFACLAVITPAVAQNLVPNPSFEALENCPDGLTSSGFSFYQTGVDTTHDFIRLAEPWFCPTSGTSDLLATCATNNAALVPNNSWGNAFPSDGDNYIAVIVYQNIADSWEGATLPIDYTEYVQVPLSEPLIPGETYRLSFHYRWVENSKFATDQLGMGLSIGSVNEGDSLNPRPLDIIPQTTTPVGQVNNASEWQFHLETIVADEAYDHLTIGRFGDYTELTVELMTEEVVSSFRRRAVYFIDEIKIEPVASVGMEEYSSINLEVFPDGVLLGENGDLTIFNLAGQIISRQSGVAGEIIPWPSEAAAAVYLLSFNGKAIKVLNPAFTR